jgi:Gamma-glutamyltransferase
MKNGSAVEAAIAALFCEGVVCLQSMGLGGGFLMTIYKRDTREVQTLNAREVAPKAANETMFNGNSTLSTVGVYSYCFNGEKSENSKIICGLFSLADLYYLKRRL